MPKYEIELSWYASMRGYDSITVEAENAEEARAKAIDDIEIDYNANCKIIDSDYEIQSTTEITGDAS